MQLTNPRKIWVLISTLLAAMILAFCGFLLNADLDTVATSYPDLDAVREDRLFDRGWLPDILPASSSEIEVTKRLFSENANGGFFFDTADYELFNAQLKPLNVLTQGNTRLVQEMAKYQKKDWSVGVFFKQGSTWFFFCDADRGYCEYRVKRG